MKHVLSRDKKRSDRPKPEVQTQVEAYLEVLKEEEGAQTVAMQRVGLTKSQMSKLRQDPEFREAEEQVFTILREELVTASMRMAKGGREAAHTRWKLSKLDPERWGDKPQIVDHRHSGVIELKSLDDEIEALLGTDDPKLLEET